MLICSDLVCIQIHACPLSALGGGGFHLKRPSAKLRNKVQIKHIPSATYSLGAAPLPNHHKNETKQIDFGNYPTRIQKLFDQVSSSWTLTF